MKLASKMTKWSLGLVVVSVTLLFGTSSSAEAARHGLRGIEFCSAEFLPGKTFPQRIARLRAILTKISSSKAKVVSPGL